MPISDTTEGYGLSAAAGSCGVFFADLTGAGSGA